MDKRTTPSGRGGKRIVVRDAESSDTLTKLYKTSELNTESDSAVDDYLDHAKSPDTEEVPEKHDRKTQHKKQLNAKKIARKKFLKKFIPVCFVIIALAVGGFFLFKPNFSEHQLDGEEAARLAADQIYYSPLTGREVETYEDTVAGTTCVMIENSPDARPQSGLADAGVVYEVNAEGGITRFMAIFQEAKPQYIGPVRSLRMTYAEFATPYQCAIAHVGGADNALNLVRNSSTYRDIDQFFNAQAYWRESKAIAGRRRYAPHNVYTSFEKLDQLNYNKGYTKSEFTGFARVSPDEITEAIDLSATTIRITMSSALYNPVFTYDATANNYKRAHAASGPHIVVDATDQQTQIAPDVVIAMKVNVVARPGSREGYVDYQTTGSNDVYIFQNGGVTAGAWRRDSVNDELRFYDQNGELIKLNRGQTWISAYPSGTGAVNWE